MDDPWYLIVEGKYSEAVISFTEQLKEGRHRSVSPILSNRGLAYLNLGNYDKALSDFHAANEASLHTSDGYLQQVGVAQWLAGRKSEAAATWQGLVIALQRGKISYTRGCAGVGSGCLLWFAGVRLGRDDLLALARELLQSRIKARTGQNWRIANWPGPIAEFLTGSLDELALRARIEKHVPVLRSRELCKAEFYIAVNALRKHHNAEAVTAFKRAAALREAVIENEYYLARHEAGLT